MLALRLFARFGYVPTMLGGLNLLAVYVVAGGYSIIWIGALFAVAIALSLLSERALPFEQSWNTAHSDVPKDVAHGIVYELSNITAILMLPLVTTVIPWAGIWPTTLPLEVQLLLAILIADFSMTMIHYSYRRA